MTGDRLLSPLLTDLYQLTMAAAYRRSGLAEREAVFHVAFRETPFGGAYAVACGLEPVLDLVAGFRFAADDLAYLATLTGDDGRPLFDAGALGYFAGLELAVDVDAVPEGTVVFAGEPLARVRGPIAHCQLLETALLTLLNFQTLVATKAARVCLAAAGVPVLEFGLRRAQGPDGGVGAARAAYVGGCAGTSNVLAGKRHGVPVKGTHAHSWVMAFTAEQEAFDAWARAMPNNAVLLVDTYDTLTGVDRAIATGRRLRAAGHRLAGIRLDSGDLAALALEARRRLDAAGFPDAVVVASGDLDEHRVAELRAAGAPIGLWGVGTRLTTAYDQPALGGIYKLAAIRDERGRWRRCLKLSDSPAKTSTPGIHQVRRFADAAGVFRRDVLYDEGLGLAASPAGLRDAGDLLVPVVRGGRAVHALPPLAERRARTLDQLARLDPAVVALREPAAYPVDLDPRLAGLKAELAASAGG